MRKARCEVIDRAEVNCVHVCSRTVRRCFLFGQDTLTGKNFDHRKPWIEELLRHFAAHFGIDLLAYAILSNHFHLILRNRPDVVATWSDTEVARRWLMICPHRRDPAGEPLPPSEAELDTIRRCPTRLAETRRRLADISWWMRLLCQRIATRANQEDEAHGRFFEERFKAIRLVDEASLVACATYVDLNPIRAAMAETIETSDHTSVQCRIEAMRADRSDEQAFAAEEEKVSAAGAEQTSAQDGENETRARDSFLAPITIDERQDPTGPCPSRHSSRCSDKGFLPMSTPEYLELLDWTARRTRSDKRGTTPLKVPPLVTRLGLSDLQWIELVGNFGRLFHHVAGRPETVDRLRSHRTGGRFRMHRRVRALIPSLT